jgi:putative PEP-CTERM system histidine kinase
VASFVALLDATDALMDARQFEAFNRLSAYVVHDLKNITAQLSLIVSNAARHRSNPAFVEDAIGTVENASAKMNRMLAQLRKGSSPVREITRFDLHRALQEAIAIRSACLPVPVLSKGNPDIVLRASRDRFTAVLEHLIQNAQEATAADGLVELRSFLDGRFAVVEIADNGCGMSERFIRERLFRPFNTTKGNAGMGIGVYESREFVLSLGGEVDVFSEPGIGTTFYLRVPIFEEPARLEANQEVEVVLCASRQKNC